MLRAIQSQNVKAKLEKRLREECEKNSQKKTLKI